MLFRNEYWFLSNMYPCSVDFNHLCFNSAEAAFQAMKTLDPDVQQEFTLLNGFEAKQFGRTVKLRPDWDRIKLDVMEMIIRAKFKNPELATKLKAIEGEIIEDNHWHDTYWGMCNGIGKNHLGKILMKLRSELTVLS